MSLQEMKSGRLNWRLPNAFRKLVRLKLSPWMKAYMIPSIRADAGVTVTIARAVVSDMSGHTPSVWPLPLYDPWSCRTCHSARRLITRLANNSITALRLETKRRVTQDTGATIPNLNVHRRAKNILIFRQPLARRRSNPQTVNVHRSFWWLEPGCSHAEALRVYPARKTTCNLQHIQEKCYQLRASPKTLYTHIV